ncbi:hypothetical protein VNO80_06073 [Phaseolus coccineus]|uniref:Uncharacterized protein n=1 Tax=Phaseolus coccineus TaxID=3886 RepID=A0AAN9NHF0_PHACN
MPPKNKGKAIAGKDAPQSSPTKVTGPEHSPNKRQKISKISKEGAPPPQSPPRNIQQQPIDPYDVYNRSRHNEYLEHAIMFLTKPVVKEPEIPDVPLPPLVYEEPPRSTGGLEDIVESAKLICRKKD